MLVNVAALCDGFAGNTTQWVLARSWDAFVSELRELQRTRQGEAGALELSFGRIAIDPTTLPDLLRMVESV